VGIYILIKEPMRCAAGEAQNLGAHSEVCDVLRDAFPSIQLSEGSAVGVDMAHDTTVTFSIPLEQTPVVTVTMAVGDDMKAVPIIHRIWEHSNWTVVELAPGGRQLKHLRGPDDVGK